MRWWLAVVVVAGCGGTPIAPPAVANDPGYPAGPYGYGAGEVLPDLTFAGKRVPVGQMASQASAEPISLGSLRAPGVRYLVVETAGAWCSDCAGDQPAMMQLEADYAAKGVAAGEVLLEGAYDAPATMDDVDGWSRDRLPELLRRRRGDDADRRTQARHAHRGAARAGARFSVGEVIGGEVISARSAGRSARTGAS
jgi:hypothetical protein